MEIDDDKKCITLHEEDFHLLKPEGLRQLMRKAMAKSKPKADDEEADDADESRQADADLHAEHKGETKGVPVTKDDFPFDLEASDSEDDASEDGEQDSSADEKPAKKKKPPFMKGK